jgi:hypothetical protein
VISGAPLSNIADGLHLRGDRVATTFEHQYRGGEKQREVGPTQEAQQSACYASPVLGLAALSPTYHSTVLTLEAIPVVYYGVMRKRVEWIRSATA